MIKIITALLCEASPLIHHFKLKLIHSSPFLVYGNENILLAISGVGSLNASTTVMHLYHLSDQNSLWLNIGVAGHLDAKLGNTFLISKVMHKNIKKSFYPYLPLKHKFRLSALKTLENPSQDYLPDTLYDMEGYGFYFAALKLSIIERVQILKIVSDNLSSDIKKISKDQVSGYIEQNISHIEELLSLMMKLKENDVNHPETSRIQNHLHFSETEKHKLIRHLSILHQNKPDEYSFESLKNFNSSKKLLDYLGNEIFNLPLIKS